MIRILMLAALLVASAAHADSSSENISAAPRFAIVIGNEDYVHVGDLANAANDARAMAGFLSAQGFHVIEAYDLDKRGFEALFAQILVEIPADSEILFYFAGHGIQIGRRNYLIPTDADLSSPEDTPFETVTLDHIVEILGARSRLQVVILDSCRNNPFGEAMLLTEIDPELYETGQGFQSMTPPINTLVAFSTSPGFVAFDGEDGNSPYTGALVRIGADQAGDSIGQVLEGVRREVIVKTEGAQVPWESSTLIEPFSFGSDEAPAVLVPEPTPGEELIAAASPELLRAVGSAPVAVAAPEGVIALEGRIDRRLALGLALVQTTRLSGDDTITVAAPKQGALLLFGAETAPYGGQPLDRAALPGLVYVPPMQPQRIGLSSAEDFRQETSLAVQLAAAGDAQDLTVTLTLTPDPCDYHAGDWLDPGGVGLARYPNEIQPEIALAACEAAVAAQPETPRFHYQLGRALQALKRYDEAAAAFQRAADLGHVRAWHALGDLSDLSLRGGTGQGDGGAGEEALAFYAKGVAAGDPYAMHALGKQYLRYGETEQRRAEGFELLSLALELGHSFAMNELGYHFIKEGSPNYQPERGLRYLTESAARGDIYGYHNLGIVYDLGLAGKAPSASDALNWYQLAAAGGHPHAPVAIGRLYFQGRLGAEDLAEAIKWYDRGLERGSAWGGANAAWIIANRAPEGYSLADAALRAAKTMALGDEQAGAAAGDVIGALPAREVDRAAQMLMVALGEEMTVDGLFGRDSRAAATRIFAARGAGTPPEEPVARAVALARLYWQDNPFRVDLY